MSSVKFNRKVELQTVAKRARDKLSPEEECNTEDTVAEAKANTKATLIRMVHNLGHKRPLRKEKYLNAQVRNQF